MTALDTFAAAECAAHLDLARRIREWVERSLGPSVGNMSKADWDAYSADLLQVAENAEHEAGRVRDAAYARMSPPPREPWNVWPEGEGFDEAVASARRVLLKGAA